MRKLIVRKSKIDGEGLFAGEDMKKGEFIQFITGKKIVRKNNSPEDSQEIPTWYGMSKYTWIDPGKSIFRYLNHSCDPSVAIVGIKKLVARRDISKGEEITVDYSMTDPDELWDMECHCGSKNCRGTIKSIQSLPLKYFKAHYPLIPKKFVAMYLKSNPQAKMIIENEK